MSVCRAPLRRVGTGRTQPTQARGVARRAHEPAGHGRPPRSVTAPAGVSLRAAVARGLQPFASKAADDAHLRRRRRLCRDSAACAGGGQAGQDLRQRLAGGTSCYYSQAAHGDEAGGWSSAVGSWCSTDHQGRSNSLPHDEAADRGRGRRAYCAPQARPARLKGAWSPVATPTCRPRRRQRMRF